MFRFQKQWLDRKLVLAACLHPYFKLDWLEGSEKLIAESWLKSEFQNSTEVNETNEISEMHPYKTEYPEEQCYDFFGLVLNNNNNSVPTLEEELMSFLKNYSRDIIILKSYPAVLNKFLLYNTGLPSSAPVERLFSIAGNVMTD